MLLSLAFFSFFLLSLISFPKALGLVLFLLPTYLIRFRIAWFSTNFLEILVLILITRQAISGTKRLNFNLFFKKNCLLSGGIFFLLLGLIFSTLFSVDKLTSLGILKSWFIIPLVFAWMIVESSLPSLKLKTKNEKLFKIQNFQLSVINSFLKFLAGSGLIVSIIGTFYLLTRNLTYDGRLKAFYEHPNHLAMYLVPCLLIAYGLEFIAQERKEKIFWSLALIIIALSLFFTYSYGAWLGAVGGILIIWRYRRMYGEIWYKRKHKMWFYSLMGLCLIGLGIIIIFSPKFQDILTTQRSSFHSRLMIWRSALYILKDHWFLGIGPGLFQKYYLAYQKFFPPYLEWAVPQPHNLFLAFWLQAGIIGFSGFILILIWFFRQGLKGIKMRKKEEKRAFLALLLMAIMASTLIHGLIDTPYWKNDLAIIFWFLIGIMLMVPLYSHPHPI